MTTREEQQQQKQPNQNYLSKVQQLGLDTTLMAGESSQRNPRSYDPSGPSELVTYMAAESSQQNWRFPSLDHAISMQQFQQSQQSQQDILRNFIAPKPTSFMAPTRIMTKMAICSSMKNKNNQQ
jgi:hypothetical protein